MPYHLGKTAVFRVIMMLGFTFLIPSMLNAQEQEGRVIATGMAVGITAESRTMAIDDALRQAVRQTMGIYISSETLVENMKLVNERIYSQTQGYIQNYEILLENRDDETYRVQVSAQVKTVELVDDLNSIGLLISKKQHPRVVVVLESRQIDFFTQAGSENIANQIESHLLQKGFDIVDANQVKLKKQVESALSGQEYSRASQIAKDFGAEVLIACVVRREFANVRRVYGTNVQFYSNEIQLKALETHSARVLYSGFRSRPPTAIDYLGPLEAASSELIEEMVASILEKWKKDINEGTTYQLSVSNTRFRELDQLTKELQGLQGISGITTQSFQSDTASLVLQFKGTIQELVGKISQIQSPGIEIMGFQSNSINIVIKQ